MDDFIINCWAEEPGIRFVAKELPNGSIEFEIISYTTLATNVLLAKATISNWRLKPLDEFLKNDLFE